MPAITPEQVDAVNDLFNVVEKARGYSTMKNIHDACWAELVAINEAVGTSTTLKAEDPQAEPVTASPA